MTFEDLHLGSILVSTVRNAPVLIFAAMAGLFAERSGVIDIGLEGKILASAFVSAAVAFTTRSPWLGILAGMGVSVILAMLQGFVAVTQKGNQLVGGIAINIAMSGLTFVVAQYFFQQGGRTLTWATRACSTWCCLAAPPWLTCLSSAGSTPS